MCLTLSISAYAGDETEMRCERLIEDGSSVPGFVVVEGMTYKLLTLERFREVTLLLSERKELKETVKLQEEKLKIYKDDLARKDAYIKFLHETIESDRLFYQGYMSTSAARQRNTQGFIINVAKSPYFNFIVGFAAGIAGRVAEEKLRESDFSLRR